MPLRRASATPNSMTMRSWPYSTASPGSTRLAPTTPSIGRDDLLRRRRACRPRRAGRPRGPASRRARPRAAGRCPTAGEVATQRGRPRTRGRAPPGRAVAARRGRARPGSGRAGGASRAGRSARRGAVARAGAGRAPRSPTAVGRPAQADAPGALADLELAEAGGAELGDQRRQQLVGQPVDRGVVGRRAPRRSRSGRRSSGVTGSGTR